MTARDPTASTRRDELEELARLIGLEVQNTGVVVQVIVRESNVLEPFLTVDRLCERLHVKRTFVDGLVREGKLPHYRVGRQTLFLESEARQVFRVLSLDDVQRKRARKRRGGTKRAGHRMQRAVGGETTGPSGDSLANLYRRNAGESSPIGRTGGRPRRQGENL